MAVPACMIAAGRRTASLSAAPPPDRPTPAADDRGTGRRRGGLQPAPAANRGERHDNSPSPQCVATLRKAVPWRRQERISRLTLGRTTVNMAGPIAEMWRRRWRMQAGVQWMSSRSCAMQRIGRTSLCYCKHLPRSQRRRPLVVPAKFGSGACRQRGGQRRLVAPPAECGRPAGTRPASQPFARVRRYRVRRPLRRCWLPAPRKPRSAWWDGWRRAGTWCGS